MQSSSLRNVRLTIPETRPRLAFKRKPSKGMETPARIEKPKKIPAPPSEELIARLNAIGQEHPFCAFRKGSDRDIF